MKPTCSTLLFLLSFAAAARAQEGQGPGVARQHAVGEGTVPAGQAAPAGQGAQSAAFPDSQLEQLVAPIALYPDALLAQILMASTYPLEIVKAARWQQKNSGLVGDELETALKNQTWDPSVKSLCGFPDVLMRMSENLDWVQDLGDAFLGQQAQVMECVQSMRRKAREAGNLKSGKELSVTEQADNVIVVQAADPEVIYVPTYYPTAVYGSWSYPYYYYPPLYPPPPPSGMFLSFTAGVVWGAAVWGDCDWGHTEVNIDIDRYNTFVDNTEIDARRQEVKERAGQDGQWQHDPQHRKGVGYQDTQVAQRYGASEGSNRVSRDQARGFGDRAGAGTRDAPASGGEGRASSPQSTAPSNRNAPSRSSGRSSGSFSGSRSPSFDRAGSSRGAASRGARGGGGRRGR